MAPKNTSPVDIFADAFLSTPVSDRHAAFNKQHSAIKRISPELFALEVPGLHTVFMSANNVHLYTKYNQALCLRDDDEFPDVVPAYYSDFARAMNRFDDSGFGWAYLDDTGKTIVWKNGLSIQGASTKIQIKINWS
ncbi:hypothetical protein B0H17DRAFT_1137967 [Mycena rosella]|uniref:Uncharacterized protein n=1 Tax=Mycena rosella TaxID=1033263 RepID=A0AAD7GE54_MYCRO|nr:hypothetical protein B0H17DRAFT_1137967 [Mycena rosella]